MEGTETAHRGPSRYSSRTKTGDDPAPNLAEDPEVFTDPAPDMAPATGPDKAAAVGMTDTVPDTGPDSAAVVGSTEPAVIVSPAAHVVTSEVAGGEGDGPGPGGRYRPDLLLSRVV
jgi:hypothetical protein